MHYAMKNVIITEEEGVDQSHEFYKNIPTGIFGSKKPRSAEEVYYITVAVTYTNIVHLNCLYRVVLMKMLKKLKRFFIGKNVV